MEDSVTDLFTIALDHLSLCAQWAGRKSPFSADGNSPLNGEVGVNVHPRRTKRFVALGSVLTVSLVVTGIASSAPATASPVKPVHGFTATESDSSIATLGADGLYRATTDLGGDAAATTPFVLQDSVSGDSGSSAILETSGPSKDALLAASRKAGVAGFNILAARTAIAAGFDAAAVTRTWGPQISRVATAIRAGASAATLQALASPAAPTSLASPSLVHPFTSADTTGCQGKAPLDPKSDTYNNNEITINYAGYACLDYSVGQDWYLVEKAVESYSTKSYALYRYLPRQEGIRHGHSIGVGPNSYLDWYPDSTTPSASGCVTKSLSIAPITGLGYGTSETLCDGVFSPYVCPNGSCAPASGPYAGSLYHAATIFATNTPKTSAGLWYGQRSLAYLHSPPGASFSSGHILVVNWINAWQGP